MFAHENSPFYRKRLDGLSFQHPAEVSRVACLEKHDIYLNTPPQGSDLLTGPLEKAYVFASGGSTGEPKFCFYSYEEWAQVTSILAEIYQVAGVTADDVVGNLFMAGNLWTSFLVANEALARIGCVTLPIAGNADVDLILRYVQLFNPTVLLGLPSILIQVAEEVQRRKLDVRVDKVLYGGEHFSQHARKLLRNVLGTTTIISAGYASVDCGPIGYQCPQAPRTVHHLLYDHQYLEILDPVTLEPQPRGTDGEIVVTNLDRRLMPILRFRTGDRGRIMEGHCLCGRRTPMFELLGRCDDVVRVGSVSVYPDDIAGALAAVEGVSQLFQIVVDTDGPKDVLTIRAESRNSHVNGLGSRVRDTLLQSHGELEEAVRMGWLSDLKVDIVPPGQLPRVRRTGKIKKVVDRRHAATE